uniref:HDC06635 n=1 Tax=Drosophila melanogaster TaxID=7227 RepID=Q6IGC2_DROME|nr:TPA_inf: HDC06635 [Drosophila melanogaster]
MNKHTGRWAWPVGWASGLKDQRTLCQKRQRALSFSTSRRRSENPFPIVNAERQLSNSINACGTTERYLTPTPTQRPPPPAAPPTPPPPPLPREFPAGGQGRAVAVAVAVAVSPGFYEPHDAGRGRGAGVRAFACCVASADWPERGCNGNASAAETATDKATLCRNALWPELADHPHQILLPPERSQSEGGLHGRHAIAQWSKSCKLDSSHLTHCARVDFAPGGRVTWPPPLLPNLANGSSPSAQRATHAHRASSLIGSHWLAVGQMGLKPTRTSQP